MRNKLNNELAVCGFAAVKKLEHLLDYGLMSQKNLKKKTVRG